MNANAAISAAIEIRKELIKATAEICNVSEDSLIIGDRRILAKEKILQLVFHI